MKKNETLKLYIEVLIEQNSGKKVIDIPPMTNVNKDYISIVPFDAAPIEETIVWDWDDNTEKAFYICT